MDTVCNQAEYEWFWRFVSSKNPHNSMSMSTRTFFSKARWELTPIPHSRSFYSSTTLLYSLSTAVTPSTHGCSEAASISLADQLFDESPHRLHPQTNTLLFRYSRENQNLLALNLFSSVHRSGSPFDGLSLSCVLKVCGVSFSPNDGKQTHGLSIKCGFNNDISVGTSLVDFYMKTALIDDGRKAFDQMGEKNVVSWTTMIAGYARNGLNVQAVELFSSMTMKGIEGNEFTYATVLAALGADGLIRKGIQVHAAVVKNGLELNTSVSNSLISLYSKAGVLVFARAVFDQMENKDLVAWNGMLSGYVSNGFDSEALELFHLMRVSGYRITQFATIIKLCGNIRNLILTRQLHCVVLKTGFESDNNIQTPLVVTYSRCNEMDDAFTAFSTMPGGKNVVLWTAMINGYLQNKGAARAVELFCQMCRQGVKPNSFTYSTVLTAHPFISPSAIHAQVIKTNNERLSTVGTSLLDAYFKEGDAESATRVFESIEVKDVVSWSAILVGYAQTGETVRAIRVFKKLGEEGVRPNEYTFSSIIHACAGPSAGAEQGRQLHGLSLKWGFSDALCVSSALLTMYAKRGNIENASKVFSRQKERDLVSWNSMISGFAQHGDGRKALEVFKEMQRENIEVDGITFIGVISACTHSGLVEEGEKYYEMMVKECKIEPREEHYSCMVDLYSRAGMLEKAMDVIKNMKFPAGPTSWLSILAGCRVQKNLELGKVAAEKLMALNPEHSAAYVLLSNIYAVTGNWKERGEVRRVMENRNVKKEAGLSWIEVKNKTHVFRAGDQTHSMSDQIYSKVEELTNRLRDLGYRPDTNYVLHDVEDEHKEAMLFHHSERLALAFGLITMAKETPIHIEKNLRVCGDCHCVFKMVSMVEEREIVVRDSNRFHHFKGGLCSCGDYW